MDAEPQTKEFRQHERVLWRVLLSLSKAGFFVPLDDARDLIHDFYVEAWEGLKDRHDPSVANFNTYVAGAFHRFARRRAVQMDRSRRRLVELEDVGELISPELGPAAALERKQAITSLRSALEKLPGLERALLVEHLGEERQSERMLADRHSLTRYVVRATLASALERVSTLLLRSHRRHIASEAPPSRAIAHLRASAPFTLDQRLSSAEGGFRSKTSSIPWTTYFQTTDGILMDERDQEAIRAALFTGNESAFHYLAENAERLRASLTESDDFEIEMPGLEFLRENPQNLSRLYEVLLSDQDEEEITEVEWVIDRARAESAVEVGEAFELMADDLPEGLLHWDDWFPMPAENQQYRDYLASQPSVLGKHALRLTRFGMTPDTIAGAMRGLQLLFDEQFEDVDFVPSRYAGPNSLLLVGTDRRVLLAEGQLQAQISTGPFVPRLEDMPSLLTNWIVKLLEHRPYCVPNYVFDRESYGTLAAISIPEWERVARPDLRALWTRSPRQAGAAALAYN